MGGRHAEGPRGGGWEEAGAQHRHRWRVCLAPGQRGLAGRAGLEGKRGGGPSSPPRAIQCRPEASPPALCPPRWCLRPWLPAWSAPTSRWTTCSSRTGPALGQVGARGLALGPAWLLVVPAPCLPRDAWPDLYPPQQWCPGDGGSTAYCPSPLQLPVTLRLVCVAGTICPGLAWAGTAGTGAVEPRPPATPSRLWTTPWAQRQVGLSREGTPAPYTPPATHLTHPSPGQPASPARLPPGSEAKGQGGLAPSGPRGTVPSLVARPLCSLRNGRAGPGGPSGLAAQPATARHRGLLPLLLVPHGLS